MQIGTVGKPVAKTAEPALAARVEASEICKAERAVVGEIQTYEGAVDYLMDIGAALVIEPGTPTHEQLLAYSWVNSAMRPASTRTTKDIVLLDAELVIEVHEMPWNKLLSFYLVAHSVSETVKGGFGAVVELIRSAGVDPDTATGNQLRTALGRIQQRKRCLIADVEEEEAEEAEEVVEGSEAEETAMALEAATALAE